MKITFTNAVAGEHFAYYPGETHDLPEPVASQYIKGGSAMAAAPLVRRRRGATIADTHMSAAALEQRA